MVNFTLSILIVLVFVLACGRQGSDDSKLSGVFNHDDGQYKALIYNRATSNYEYTICHDVVVLRSIEDCTKKETLILFGDIERLVRSTLKALQQNIMELPDELSYHVAIGSESLLSGELRELSNAKAAHEKKKAELQRKLRFLEDHEIPVEEVEKELEALSEDVFPVNETLSELHPSAHTLMKIIDAMIELIHAGDFTAATKIDDPQLHELYKLLIRKPRTENDLLYLDSDQQRVWKVNPSKVTWTQVQSPDSPNSCERYYGATWHLPTEAQLERADVSPIIRGRKAPVPFNSLDADNVVFAELGAELRAQRRHFVCTSTRAQPYRVPVSGSMK